MAGLGRLPKPDAQRRSRHPILGTGSVRRILASEHASGVPNWPLSTASKRELQFWTRLWATPVSAVWEELGWTDAVARYARLMAVAEAPGPPGIVLIEVRQLEDRLGLSPMALLRLRWQIVDDEALEQATGTHADNVLDVRERLRASE
jgi:hypothetical protein